MKKILKISLILLVICICTLFYKVNGAYVSLSVDNSNPTVGQTVNVTVTIYAATWQVNVSGSASDSIVGYDDDGNNTTKTKTYSVSSNSTGKYTVSVSGNVTDESDEYSTPVNKSIVINFSEASSNSSSSGSSNTGSSSSSNSTKKSNNSTTTKEPEKEVKKSDIATLESLSIEDEGIAIEPEFSADVYDYTIKVPNEIMQLNIAANPTDSKATVEISGNENFVVGENNVLVKVTAEDGTTQTYTIKVIKEREKLALKTLKVKYKDEEGNLIDLVLTPEFVFDIYEYTLEEISYKINELLVECEANLEGAKIEVTGNNNLQAGENEIIIKITIPAELDHELQEGEEKPEDEVITYKIKFNKEQTPTFWQKIKNKIKAIFGTIKDKYDNNKKQITLVGLAVCIGAMLILSVYIAIDAKKYKILIQKLEKLSAINTAEIADNSNNIEEIYKDKNINENDNLEKNDAKGSSKGGRHF